VRQLASQAAAAVTKAATELQPQVLTSLLNHPELREPLKQGGLLTATQQQLLVAGAENFRTTFSKVKQANSNAALAAKSVLEPAVVGHNMLQPGNASEVQQLYGVNRRRLPEIADRRCAGGCGAARGACKARGTCLPQWQPALQAAAHTAFFGATSLD
jgi:hypothetical protein